MPLQKLRQLTFKAVTLRGSIARAFLFVLAWAFVPWWLFIPIALCLYFVPLPEANITVVPFLALLALCVVYPPSWFFAIVFALLFGYILLVKDLYIIDRKLAYEMLTLVLVFLLLRVFYLDMDGRGGISVVLYAFIVAGIFAGLISGFMACFPFYTDGAAPDNVISPQKPLPRIITAIAFLLFFQLLMTGFFLPLDFIYQSVVVFLFATLIMELLPSYPFGSFSRSKLLTTSSVVFTLLVLVLGSARWRL